MLNIRTLPRHLVMEKNTDGTKLKIRRDRFMETLSIGPPVLTELPDITTNPDPAYWINNENSLVAEFENAIKTLQARGVKVIVFQIPVCSQNIEFNQNTYAEPALFNELKSRSQATWLAADDLSYSDEIECTDGAHLTTKSAHTVTKALANWLNAQPSINL